MSNYNIQLVEFLLEYNSNNMNLLRENGYYYTEDPLDFWTPETRSCYFMIPLKFENWKYGYKLQQDEEWNPVIVWIWGACYIQELRDSHLVPEEYVEDTFKSLGIKVDDIVFLKQK